IELGPSHRTLLEKHIEDLEQLGLVMEPFGTTAMLLRAVPVGLGPIHASLLIPDLLEDLAQWENTPSLEGRAQPVLAMLACKSAVQAGRSMAFPEIERIAHDWVAG